MSNIHLYTTYYHERNERRNKELLTCIQKNINNTSLSKIFILNEGNYLGNLSDKVVNVPINERPTYNEFILLINRYTDSNSINIIANTDIYLNDSIAVLKDIDFKDNCLALSRWDVDAKGNAYLFNRNDSQDTWIFKGKIKENLQGDFHLGVPRCDNRFLYELEKAGYKVLNPAYSIQSYHLHGGIRVDYTSDNLPEFIPPPYKYLYPHNVYGLVRTLWFNVTHNHRLGAYHYDLKKTNFWLPIKLIRKSIKLLTGYQLPLWGYK